METLFQRVLVFGINQHQIQLRGVTFVSVSDPTTTATFPQPGSYHLIWQATNTYSGGSCILRDTVKITIDQSPATPDAGPDILQCKLHPLNLNAKAPTDGNGCIYYLAATITQPTTFSARVNSSSNVTCYGAADGTATVVATGGTSGYTYLWNTTPAKTTATVTNLSPQTYIVTVTDANGCTTTANITITSPSAAILVSGTKTNPTCYGSNNGRIHAVVSGGTPAYTYAWSNGYNAHDLSGLTAGTYTVIVTDANGCTAEKSYLLTEPAAVSLTSGSIVNTSCNALTGSVLLTGSEAGTVTLNGVSKASPATYSSQSAGNYTATFAATTNGCSASNNFIISNSSTLSATVGFSSSLPLQTQIAAIQTVEGLENAQLFRPGYAIEYDFFDPTQLKHTLETKRNKKLYFAGQINGTTGYEEAGGQGLIAGINAHINCQGGEAFTLARNEAYIGVLIDDLVTKGVDEPYRMFTSRAEYRLILRQDDADMRLTEKGYALGLATKNRLEQLETKKEAQAKLTNFIQNTSIKPNDINEFLASRESSELKHGCKLSDLVLRPQIGILDLAKAVPALHAEIDSIASRTEETVEATEVLLKYEGYIVREKLIAEKLQRLEHVFIKDRIDYATVQSLSTEARQKLTKISPETIGQASRIPGISPSDVNILLVLLGR